MNANPLYRWLGAALLALTVACTPPPPGADTMDSAGAEVESDTGAVDDDDFVQDSGLPDTSVRPANYDFAATEFAVIGNCGPTDTANPNGIGTLYDARVNPPGTSGTAPNIDCDPATGNDAACWIRNADSDTWNHDAGTNDTGDTGFTAEKASYDVQYCKCPASSACDNNGTAPSGFTTEWTVALNADLNDCTDTVAGLLQINPTTGADETDTGTYPSISGAQINVDAIDNAPYDGIDQDCNSSPSTSVDLGDDEYDGDGDGYIQEIHFPGYAAYRERYDLGNNANAGPFEYVTCVTPNANCNDCNDASSAVSPGANEIWYDGVDQNCDTLNDYDQDGDGQTCQPSSGSNTCAASSGGQTDCYDVAGAVGVATKQRTNGTGGWLDVTGCHTDVDGDFYGKATGVLTGVTAGQDCDDGSTGSNPGVAENTTTGLVGDSIDQDCDTFYACFADTDNDEFGVPLATTAAVEISTSSSCGAATNGASAVATDCLDSGTNADLTKPRTNGTGGWKDTNGCYQDVDLDGWGRSTTGLPTSGHPGGSVASGADCDDNATTGNLTMPRTNGTDGWLGTNGCQTDSDGDKYGSSTAVAPITAGNDCNDGSTSFHPGIAENTTTGLVGNAVDEDCDTFYACFADTDNDEFGVPLATTAAVEITNSSTCGAASNGASAVATDCLDSGANAVLTKPRTNGTGGWKDTTGCYQDVDLDGWGRSSTGLPTSGHPGGSVASGADCDDNATTGNLTMPRTNGVDGWLDGAGCQTDADGDFYGYNNASSPIGDGSDCNDGTTSVHPGIAENTTTGLVGNSTDEDCDTFYACFADTDNDEYGVPLATTAAVEITTSSTCAAVTNGAAATTATFDCLDSDVTVKPGGTQICDGINNICKVDGTLDTIPTSEIDNDADGYVDCIFEGGFVAANWKNGTVTGDEDCADANVYPNNKIYPGAPFRCDGFHNDCDTWSGSWTAPATNGKSPNMSHASLLTEVDNDDDTYVECTFATDGTAATAGNWGNQTIENPDVAAGGDCVDTGANAFQTKPRVNGTAGWLDPSGCYTDVDLDQRGRTGGTPDPLPSGATAGTDCLDIASSCTNVCSDLDTDGFLDCNNDRCFDDDSDDYGITTTTSLIGTATVSVGSCTSDGTTACTILDAACTASDCDDANNLINPGINENGTPARVGNAVDEDCDDMFACFKDDDNDTFGAPIATTPAVEVSENATCDDSVNEVANDSTDCLDTSAVTKPRTNGVAGWLDPTGCHTDEDGDFYGNLTPASGVTAGSDCDDSVATGTNVNIGINENGTAARVGNAIDEDCDDKFACFADPDKDGFGVLISQLAAVEVNDTFSSCAQPTLGAALNATDCNTLASSCTTDCTDGDDDGQPECLDLCIDTDEDNYGTTRTAAPASGNNIVGAGTITVANCKTDTGANCSFLDAVCAGTDCNPNASSCNTTCSDADGDTFDECLDRCGDTDSDQYGITRLNLIVGGGTIQVDDCTTNGLVGATAIPCTLNDAYCDGADCNDANPLINPAIDENGTQSLVGNTVDEDCDGNLTCFKDDDQDGFGTNIAFGSTAIREVDDANGTCNQPSLTVANDALDCDDVSTTAAVTFPGAAEYEQFLAPAPSNTCMRDRDLDGWGDLTPIAGVGIGRDCQDDPAGTASAYATIAGNLIKPSAGTTAGTISWTRTGNETFYDAIDQNCYENFDPAPNTDSDFDQDGDGQECLIKGSPAVLLRCPSTGLDCVDDPAGLPKVPGSAGSILGHLIKHNPDRTVETWYDGIDQNCLVDSDYDQDNDGFTCSPTLVSGCSSNTTGTMNDCYDSLTPKAATILNRPAVAGAAINPSAIEDWYDGVDQNCGADNDFDQDGDGFIAMGDADNPGVVFGGAHVQPGNKATGDCVDLPEGELTDGGQTILGIDINPTKADPAYDGVDQNCDGLSDYDADGDTFNSCAHGFPNNDDDTDTNGAKDDCDCIDTVGTTTGIGGVTVNNNTIKPTSSLASPTRLAEVFYNGIDQNCDGKSDFDRDLDGYDCDPLSPLGTTDCPGVPVPPTGFRDCNDQVTSGPNFAPNRPEVCEGSNPFAQQDNDCDGSVNTQGGTYFFDNAQLGNSATAYYLDADTDTYGAEGSAPYFLCSRSAETNASFFVTNDDDCKDSDNAVNPGATELCNDDDDNCNNRTDEPTPGVDPPPGCVPFFFDQDRDGVATDDPEGRQICVCTGFSGDPINKPEICNPDIELVTEYQNVAFGGTEAAPECWSFDNTDCRDTANNIHPPPGNTAKTEYIDGFDNDCDNRIPVVELDCDNDGAYPLLPIPAPLPGEEPIEPVRGGFQTAAQIGLVSCNDIDDAPTIKCFGDKNIPTSCDDETGLFVVDTATLEGFEVFADGARVGQINPGCTSAVDGGFDCDDNCPVRCEGLAERCDGVDNDCDGEGSVVPVQDANGLPDTMEPGIPRPGFVGSEELDLDGDGQITCTVDGAPGQQTELTDQSCTPIDLKGDCNDMCWLIKPEGGVEVCNGFLEADDCVTPEGENFQDGDADRFRACGTWGNAEDSAITDEQIFMLLRVDSTLLPQDADDPRVLGTLLPLIPARDKAEECDAPLANALEAIGVSGRLEEDENWWKPALEECITADVCRQAGGVPPASGWPADCTGYENVRCGTVGLMLSADADDTMYEQPALLEGCLDGTDSYPEQVITRTVWSHDRIVAARRLVVEWECYRLYGSFGCGGEEELVDGVQVWPPTGFASPYSAEVPGDGGFVENRVSTPTLSRLLESDPRWWKELTRYDATMIQQGALLGCWGNPVGGVDRLRSFDFTGGDCDSAVGEANRDLPEGPDDLVGLYNGALAECSTCLDGVDNNCNGYVDCADPACARCFVGQGIGCVGKGETPCVSSGCTYGGAPAGGANPGAFGALFGLALAAAGLRRQKGTKS